MPRLLIPFLIAASPLFAAGEDGRAIFQINCAICHKPGAENRTPTPEALKRLTNSTIVSALETGAMKAQGATLNAAQKQAVADFLVPRSTASVDLARSNDCGSTPVISNVTGWNGWGADLSNTRFQTAKVAGLTRADIPNLKLKWAFGLPNTGSMFGQPTAVGDRLFFGSGNGTVYSLNAATGCVYWTFKAPVQVRTPITVAKLQNGKYLAFFGDGSANVYAVDTQTGEQVWKTKIDEHKLAGITGAPQFYNGRVYIPVRSGSEEMIAAQPNYQCCTFRGSLSALDAETGKQVWKTFTIPDPPSVVGKNSAGSDLLGPSGAGIWSAPTIDVKRKLIYVGTGNNYSDPPTKYGDAILAFDLETGSLKWSKQMNQDVWNYSCEQKVKSSCPEKPDRDTDIGTSPVLHRLANGKDVLLFGQKSAFVRAIDPDKRGEIVWEKQIGKGGSLGGVMWGLAVDFDKVYVPLSDIHPGPSGGLFAFNTATGEQAWYAAPVEPACKGKPGCNAAQMAPATAIDGVVFSGSLDGHLRAYSTTDGKVIWDYDTLQEYETVNGVKAHGGSLNATGPTIANGMLYVNSGYSQLTGMAGNVLIAFSK